MEGRAGSRIPEERWGKKNKGGGRRGQMKGRRGWRMFTSGMSPDGYAYSTRTQLASLL